MVTLKLNQDQALDAINILLESKDERITELERRLEVAKEAVKIAANHKWGDGDYTAFFNDALATLNGE